MDRTLPSASIKVFESEFSLSLSPHQTAWCVPQPHERSHLSWPRSNRGRERDAASVIRYRLAVLPDPFPPNPLHPRQHAVIGWTVAPATQHRQGQQPPLSSVSRVPWVQESNRGPSRRTALPSKVPSRRCSLCLVTVTVGDSHLRCTCV